MRLNINNCPPGSTIILNENDNLIGYRVEEWTTKCVRLSRISSYDNYPDQWLLRKHLEAQFVDMVKNKGYRKSLELEEELEAEQSRRIRAERERDSIYDRERFLTNEKERLNGQINGLKLVNDSLQTKVYDLEGKAKFFEPLMKLVEGIRDECNGQGIPNTGTILTQCQDMLERVAKHTQEANTRPPFWCQPSLMQISIPVIREVNKMLDENNYIGAIKLIRENGAGGLADSKNFIDTLRADRSKGRLPS